MQMNTRKVIFLSLIHIYVEEDGGHKLSGPFIDIEQSEDTDVKSIQKGYITITPLKIKLDDDDKIKELQKLF